MQLWVKQKCGCDVTGVEEEMERRRRLVYPCVSEDREALLGNNSSEISIPGDNETETSITS